VRREPGLSVSELAQRLGVTVASAGRLLDPLVAAGVVERDGERVRLISRAFHEALADDPDRKVSMDRDELRLLAPGPAKGQPQKRTQANEDVE
jgi:DNA-binding IclR family transcriptional regulator